MNNLLVGNGINIQFNKTDYTTQQIVLRILKNCDRDDFPSHIIVNFPYLLKNYIGQLFLEARDILEDKYDNFTNCTAEDESLKSFKKQNLGNLFDSLLSHQQETLCFRTLFLIAFCDSDIYLTTSFRHCQELFSFNFIIFKRNQITFRCAISQSRHSASCQELFFIMKIKFF